MNAAPVGQTRVESRPLLSDEAADELTLSEVTIGGRPPRAVVLGRFPRSDLLAARTGIE